MVKSLLKINFILIFVSLIPSSALTQALLLQSTTSTRNSGLYEKLLPAFEKETGIQVNVVAVGTGQALRNAENCEGDLLIVHSKESEEKFVKDGFGLIRFDLMYNDYIIIGPEKDPANIRGSKSFKQALLRIFIGQHKFISRGDDSGTHKREMKLWSSSSIDPEPFSGVWYLEVGAGMGNALNIAAELNGYILSDRATWISFKNKRALNVLYENDDSLFNQYGVVLINPKKCPNTNHKDAKIFFDWLISPQGQKEIANYKFLGIQLFYPNAG